MKEIPSREQVMDALATYKQLYKAANALRTTAPTLKKWMSHYGITANHNVKCEPKDEHINKGRDFRFNFCRWFKRFIKKG